MPSSASLFVYTITQRSQPFRHLRPTRSLVVQKKVYLSSMVFIPNPGVHSLAVRIISFYRLRPCVAVVGRVMSARLVPLTFSLASQIFLCSFYL